MTNLILIIEVIPGEKGLTFFRLIFGKLLELTQCFGSRICSIMKSGLLAQ